MFKAICFNGVNGQPYKPVKLTSFSMVWQYVNIQKRLYPEVRIYDGKTLMVLAVEGMVIKPGIWCVLERDLISQI